MTATISNRNISEVEDKIPDTRSLVTTTVLDTKIGEVENKVLHHAKYITTQEFHKLIAENFAARITQANIVSKTDFTSNKTIYLEVRKTLNCLITID